MALLIAVSMAGLALGHSEYLPYFIRRMRETEGRPRVFDRSFLAPGGESLYLKNIRRITNGGTNAEASRGRGIGPTG